MKEYRVTRDVSLKGENDLKVLERMANDLAADGFRLSAAAVAAIAGTTKIYMWWERERPDPK